tara:strand:+ start:934 stop:1323 length:390 start_codon:yes stop_codon:yes gene_type:complete
MTKTKILNTFKDKRGSISDIIYKDNINHITLIKSKKNVIRGNHYHKKSTQYAYVTKGKLEYYYKNINNKKSRVKKIVLKENEMVLTKPGIAHAFKTITNNEFLVFSKGIRGGKDYEKDTYRLEKKLIIE